MLTISNTNTAPRLFFQRYIKLTLHWLINISVAVLLRRILYGVVIEICSNVIPQKCALYKL